MSGDNMDPLSIARVKLCVVTCHGLESENEWYDKANVCSWPVRDVYPILGEAYEGRTCCLCWVKTEQGEHIFIITSIYWVVVLYNLFTLLCIFSWILDILYILRLWGHIFRINCNNWVVILYISNTFNFI